uniref:tRNA (guanine(10)-N(2))-methyltransferase TRMT11 n=1 Tax=Strigamia maritima TaxID=126957 RepID=T1IPG6_STRMM
MPSFRQYLIWFANEHIEFKLPEIESIVSLLNLDLQWIERYHKEPYVIIGLPSEDHARLIASRSVLTKCIVELWGRANSSEELHGKLKNLPEEFLRPYSSPTASFKFVVESFCKSLDSQEKLDKIEEFNYLPFEGPVKLNSPCNTFYLIEHYGIDQNNIPEKPVELFFGRWVLHTLVVDAQRRAIHQLSLKKRMFIGNTSMDAQLALIMANQAKITKGSLVLDPFVGTGSILVAAAYFGAYVVGTDIDYLVIHGKCKPTRAKQKKRRPDESVRANLKQYGLENQYLDVLVADASQPLWTNRILFDAIITDPPYGIREATEKIGTLKLECKIKEEHIANHIPSKVSYSLDHLFRDLLDLSVQLLRLGGRLVYWLPVNKEDYSEYNLPTHPCFKVVHNSEQLIAKHSSRRLITMEKISEPK